MPKSRPAGSRRPANKPSAPQNPFGGRALRSRRAAFLFVAMPATMTAVHAFRRRVQDFLRFESAIKTKDWSVRSDPACPEWKMP